MSTVDLDDKSIFWGAIPSDVETHIFGFLNAVERYQYSRISNDFYRYMSQANRLDSQFYVSVGKKTGIEKIHNHVLRFFTQIRNKKYKTKGVWEYQIWFFCDIWEVVVIPAEAFEMILQRKDSNLRFSSIKITDIDNYVSTQKIYRL